MNGLINLGNTCYMNSIIQCISHLDFLSYDNQDLLTNCGKTVHRNDFDLMQSWLKLDKSLKISKVGRINPKEFYQTFIEKLQKNNYYFVGFDQNDAGEFMTIFFDLLHKTIEHKIRLEISGTIKNKRDKIAVDSIRDWRRFFEDKYSYIVSSTYSQLLNITSCNECDYMTTNHDPIQIITLHLKPNSSTIYDLLRDYVKLERLDDWKCDQCKRSVHPEKKCVFWNLSDILIFQLKTYTTSLQKITRHIEYPTVLKMNRFCMNYEESSMTYELCGICIQMGTLNGGHYIAICKDGEDWNVYNDTSVFKTTESDMLKKNPYCLFYRRV